MPRALLRTLVVLGILSLVPALIGCPNPAQDKPEAEVGETVQGGEQGHKGRRFVITEGSTVGFTGSKITGSHEGGFRSFDGEIHVVDGDASRSQVAVTIDTTSLWADNDRLTGHLKSPDFFDVEQHPKAQFVSTKIERVADGYMVTGNLDLHGVQKSIRFPADITVAGDKVSAKAEFVIQRFDFAIEYKGKADDLIRDEVVIKLDLVADPAGDA